MKIRQGFVSNSSSSSFVVALSKDQEITPEAIKKLLFKDREFVIYYDYKISTQSAAEQVCNDINKQKPNVSESIDSALSGYLPGEPDLDDFQNKTNGAGLERYNWDAYEKASDQFKKEYIEKFKKSLPKDTDLYVFEYSDNDGSFFCTLEHGDIFENVPHIRISHH